MDDASEIDLKHPAADRVRWDDEEAARPTCPGGLRRTLSNGSMSIRSVRTRREVDPAVALPIQYRTV